MKLKDLITEKLELGLGGYKAYNEIMQTNFNGVERNLKRFLDMLLSMHETSI